MVLRNAAATASVAWSPQISSQISRSWKALMRKEVPHEMIAVGLMKKVTKECTDFAPRVAYLGWLSELLRVAYFEKKTMTVERASDIVKCEFRLMQGIGDTVAAGKISKRSSYARVASRIFAEVKEQLRQVRIPNWKRAHSSSSPLFPPKEKKKQRKRKALISTV